MNTQVDEKIDAIYDEYLEEAERVKLSANTLPFPNRYWIGSMIGLLLIVGVLLRMFSPYVFCVGAFIMVISVGLRFITANPRAKKEAEKSAQSRPGFIEFYELYSKGKYWPYQIVPGEKYEKFLTIIGRKGSE